MATEMLAIQEDQNLMIVTPSVETLDARIAADFRDQLQACAQDDHGKPILLDLCNISFMDSSGLAAVVYCFQMTQIRKRLVICGAQRRVQQLFEMTRLEDVVRIFPTREEAVTSLATA